ncbi:hypothetical protein B0H13DRAFT_1922527 [Mycena leptocephala]|nr:hypothetical protein B0H13DRAFT_1922527 [Mycena leptocephala]
MEVRTCPAIVRCIQPKPKSEAVKIEREPENLVVKKDIESELFSRLILSPRLFAAAAPTRCVRFRARGRIKSALAINAGPAIINLAFLRYLLRAFVVGFARIWHPAGALIRTHLKLPAAPVAHQHPMRKSILISSSSPTPPPYPPREDAPSGGQRATQSHEKHRTCRAPAGMYMYLRLIHQPLLGYEHSGT